MMRLCEEHRLGGVVGVTDTDCIGCEVDALQEQLVLAVAVAEAARWACVAVLDHDTSAADMAVVRPAVAEQLLDALKAYDDDRTKRGIVSVSKAG